MNENTNPSKNGMTVNRRNMIMYGLISASATMFSRRLLLRISAFFFSIKVSIRHHIPTKSTTLLRVFSARLISASSPEASLVWNALTDRAESALDRSL